MRPYRLLAALFLLAVPTRGRAQEDTNMVHLKDLTGIQRDGATYRLTLPILPRFAAALHEVVALRKNEPAVFMEATRTSVPPKMQAIYARAKISADEWNKFFLAALTARMIGEVNDNSADFPILQANIRFVNAHPKEMAPIDADIATFLQDMGAKP